MDAGADGDTPNTFVDPLTGIEFPTILGELELVGTGARTNWFLTTYAAGTYVDKNDAAQWNESDDIVGNLCDPASSKTIRVVVHRATRFGDAIIDSIAPKLKGEKNVLQLIDDFRALNHNEQILDEGDVVDMAMSAPGVLVYSLKGEKVGEIKSDVFVRALANVFFGEEAVSQALLDNVVEGIKGFVMI